MSDVLFVAVGQAKVMGCPPHRRNQVKWFCRPFGTSSKWNDSGEGVLPLPVVFRPVGTFSRGLKPHWERPYDLITSNL